MFHNSMLAIYYNNKFIDRLELGYSLDDDIISAIVMHWIPYPS
jgi:hypothetical protein